MELKVYERPKFDKITLTASLPDMGRVGGLVPKFLIEHLKAKMFAEIYSFDKPYVLCKDGLISHYPSVYRMHYSKKASLIIFTGEEQPQDVSSLYELCNMVIDVAEKSGNLKRVYTAGGYFRERLEHDPKVFGVANMSHLLDELDRIGIREIGSEVSSITWFNGLLLGVSLMRNVEGIGLYGELDDPQIEQPKAAKAVLKAIFTLLSLPQIDALKEDSSAEYVS
jgi:proteasome assembly chaperone (PAC2) family protein